MQTLIPDTNHFNLKNGTQLAGPTKAMRNVFSRSGLSKIIESFAEVEAAIHSFSRKES